MLSNLILNLSKIRTGFLYNKSSVSIYNFNNVLISIIKILYKQGFIKSFLIFESKIDRCKTYVTIFINQSYITSKTLLSSLKWISKPSLNMELGYKDLCRLKKKNIFYLFFTSKGFLDLESCLKNKVGGKLLFII